MEEVSTKNPIIFYFNTLGHWVAGTNDSLTKHLMFQVFFFIISCKFFAEIVSICLFIDL